MCQFCDTDFVGIDGAGGGRFSSAQALAKEISKTWGDYAFSRFVVFTGGEPLLQLDRALIAAVHAEGFEIAIETNGTLEPPSGIDWICVSPKANSDLRLKAGSELKLVFPQAACSPEAFVRGRPHARAQDPGRVQPTHPWALLSCRGDRARRA